MDLVVDSLKRVSKKKDSLIEDIKSEEKRGKNGEKVKRASGMSEITKMKNSHICVIRLPDR